MGKSEKFYHIYPVLSMFMQVTECVSVCGCLSRCSVNSLKNRLWGELFQLLLWENPWWDWLGSTEFCSSSLWFPSKLVVFSITNFWDFFSFHVIATWDVWVLPLQGELMTL